MPEPLIPAIPEGKLFLIHAKPTEAKLLRSSKESLADLTLKDFEEMWWGFAIQARLSGYLTKNQFAAVKSVHLGKRMLKEMTNVHM